MEHCKLLAGRIEMAAEDGPPLDGHGTDVCVDSFWVVDCDGLLDGLRMVQEGVGGDKPAKHGDGAKRQRDQHRKDCNYDCLARFCRTSHVVEVCLVERLVLSGPTARSNREPKG